MLLGGAHITGGLGGSQEEDEATAASSAAAVRKLTNDDRLAGFLQGASEEVNWKVIGGARRKQTCLAFARVDFSCSLCDFSSKGFLSSMQILSLCSLPNFFPGLAFRCSRC
jgi:hypothetical protein